MTVLCVRMCFLGVDRSSAVHLYYYRDAGDMTGGSLELMKRLRCSYVIREQGGRLYTFRFPTGLVIREVRSVRTYA